MTRNDYIEAVVSGLRRLTPKEEAAVREELSGHIEDHMEVMLEMGWEESLAEERTLAAMGDPAETARELDKQYPLRWLVLRRVALVLLALLCASVLLEAANDVRWVWDKYQACRDPYSQFNDWEELGNLETDIRVPLGNDVLWVCGTGTDPEQGKASVFTLMYDHRLFGRVSENHCTMEYLSLEGEVLEGGGGGSRGSGIAQSRRTLEVPAGAEAIILRVQRYDQVHEIRVPLKWEETP